MPEPFTADNVIAFVRERVVLGDASKPLTVEGMKAVLLVCILEELRSIRAVMTRSSTDV